MALVEMECPNCGAKLEINKNTYNSYVCKYCNTNFINEEFLNKNNNDSDYTIGLNNVKNAQKYKTTSEYHKIAYAFIKQYPRSVDGLYYYLLSVTSLMNETGSYRERYYIDNMNRYYNDYLKIEINEERKNEITTLVNDLINRYDKETYDLRIDKDFNKKIEKKLVKGTNGSKIILVWFLIFVAFVAFIIYLECLFMK